MAKQSAREIKGIIEAKNREQNKEQLERERQLKHQRRSTSMKRIHGERKHLGERLSKEQELERDAKERAEQLMIENDKVHNKTHLLENPRNSPIVHALNHSKSEKFDFFKRHNNIGGEVAVSPHITDQSKSVRNSKYNPDLSKLTKHDQESFEKKKLEELFKRQNMKKDLVELHKDKDGIEIHDFLTGEKEIFSPEEVDVVKHGDHQVAMVAKSHAGDHNNYRIVGNFAPDGTPLNDHIKTIHGTYKPKELPTTATFHDKGELKREMIKFDEEHKPKEFTDKHGNTQIRGSRYKSTLEKEHEDHIERLLREKKENEEIAKRNEGVRFPYNKDDPVDKILDEHEAMEKKLEHSQFPVKK